MANDNINDMTLIDITTAEIITDTTNVRVPVIQTVDGVPTIKRMDVATFTAGVSEAVADATQQANAAQQAATSAQTASTAAMTSALNADNKAAACQSAIDDFQEILDDYLSDTDQQVKSRLMEVTVDSIQLFDDFKLATGYTGTYNDFLILLGQGGGGGSITVDTAMSTTSTNPVQNKVISSALVGKQDLMESLTTLDIIGLLN